MSEVEQLAQEQFKFSFRNRLCEMLSEIEAEHISAFMQGYAKGETDEKFRTKQVVISDSAEVVSLRNQISIARGLLEKWYNQHSDKSYTETFYDALIKATEEFIWGNICVN